MFSERALTALRAQLTGEPDADTLAQAAQGGDLSAFEGLVRRYQRRVFGLAYRHLHDPDEAQDLAQEVFVRLYRNLGQYDPERAFEHWFWRLAANVASSYRRRRPPAPIELPTTTPADARADTLPLERALADL